MKDFIYQYNSKKEIFYLNKKHGTTDLSTKKYFFPDNYIVHIFLFITAVISLLVTTLAIYLLCKHKKLKMLVASLALTANKRGRSSTTGGINTECKILTYISLALTTFSLVMVATLHYRKSKLCRGCMFSKCGENNGVHFRLQYYVSKKLCKTAGSIHLFKITGMLK